MRAPKTAGAGSMWGRGLSGSELAPRSKNTAPGRRAASKSRRPPRPSSCQLASTRRRSGAPRRSARSAVEISGGRSAMAQSSRPGSGAGQGQLDHVGATGAEAGLAIGEIEPPQPAEPIVEGSEAADVLPGRLEALVPQAQGLGVVVAEPLDRLPAEGGGGDDRLEGRFRG